MDYVKSTTIVYILSSLYGIFRHVSASTVDVRIFRHTIDYFNLT
jgi:hypothetical protein